MVTFDSLAPEKERIGATLPVRCPCANLKEVRVMRLNELHACEVVCQYSGSAINTSSKDESTAYKVSSQPRSDVTGYSELLAEKHSRSLYEDCVTSPPLLIVGTVAAWYRHVQQKLFEHTKERLKEIRISKEIEKVAESQKLSNVSSEEAATVDQKWSFREGVVHTRHSFEVGRRCRSGKMERHRACKQRSCGKTWGTNNDCGKNSRPGKVTTRILVLLLISAACAEVRSHPSSLDGSQTGRFWMSLESTETSIKVKWTMPDSNVREFKVISQQDTFFREISYIDSNSASTTDFADLMPCHAFNVSIQPLDADGNQISNSRSASISTRIATPPAVTGLFSQNRAGSVTLTWQRPATECVITAYTITYSGVAKWNPRIGHTGSSTLNREDANDATSIVIHGLKPYTDYTMKVTPSTDKGVGESTLINTTTEEAAPTKPTNLVMLQSTGSTVLLSWKEPDELNGELKSYDVSCHDSERLVHTEATQHPVQLIDGLSACTEYTVQVAASSAGGRGAPTTITVKTRAETPPPVTAFVVRNITLHSFTLTWERPVTACEITTYNITCTAVAKREPRTEEPKGKTTISEWTAKDVTRIDIDGLQPNTDYIVIVTASTEAGVGAAVRIDYLAAGAGDVSRDAESQESNLATRLESNSNRHWSNTAPALVACPSAALMASVILLIHVAF